MSVRLTRPAATMRILAGTCAGIVACVLCAIASSSAAATVNAPAPSVDYVSMLKKVRMYDSGILAIDSNIGCIFMPDESIERGTAEGVSEPFRTSFVLVDPTGAVRPPIATSVFAWEGVYSVMRTSGGVPQFEAKEPGDYIFRMMLGDEVIGSLPFNIEMSDGGDPFDPKPILNVTGAWTDLACLSFDSDVNRDPNALVRMWTRTSGAARERIALEVRFGGRVIYETVEGVVTEMIPKEQEFRLLFPEAAGGKNVLKSDFLKQDGMYEIVVRKNGDVSDVFPVEVRAGKFVASPRSALDYTPHDMFLTPRRWNGSRRRPEDLIWMHRRGTTELAGIANPAPTAPDTSGNWIIESSVAPNAPFTITHTDVPIRFDAGLAIGDGVIGFGTGGFNGVAWMAAGDTAARSVPEGQTLRSAWMAACGKKLVFVRNRQVVIFDTTTETLTPIPEDVIHLAAQVRELDEAAPIAVSGNLIATINEASKTVDRAVVKVIDVSGPEPRIMSLANAEFQGREASSVGVDATSGIVAVSSNGKSALWHGVVADGAALNKLDLSGHDGVKVAPIQVEAGRIGYRDAAGTSRFRVITPATGSIGTFGTVKLVRAGFALTPTGFAQETGGVVLRATFGPDGNASGAPASNAGADMSDGNGNMGVGSSMVMTPDGTIFIAGDMRGGIGSGEYLMMLTGDAWSTLNGADGTPLRAVDVAIGPGHLAFKTGSNKETTISYATFGERIQP